MLQHERINNIINLLYKNNRVTTKQLCDLYCLSDVTIRKDFAQLEKMGIIKKVHGGAILKSSVDDKIIIKDTDATKIENYEVKYKVAKLAAQSVNDGETIFIGSGSTCYLLAKLLKDKKGLSVVTNNISAISELIPFVSKIYIVGGEISTIDDKTYFSSVEDPTPYLKSVYVNKSFTSCFGIDLSAGVTVNSIISTYIYKSLPLIKGEWHLMIEKNKFNKIGLYKVCDLNQFSSVICDEVPKEYEDMFNKSNINTISN